MTTLTFSQSPRLTAGFILAILLFVGMGAGGLVEHRRAVAADEDLRIALGRLDAAAGDLFAEERGGLRSLLSAQRARQARAHALLGAAPPLGAVLAAATLLVLRVQARRRLRADEQQARVLGAETVRAELTLAEQGRALTALQSSWEELLHAAESARRAAARAERLVDERDRTLAALCEARAQAEASSRAKDEFLAVLSHELRSPLHAMLGWLTIVKKGLAAGRNVDQAVATVERNVHLQTRLVNDLLDASRLVSGKLTIAAEPVDLAMVVHTAVENARPAATVKGVELCCSVGALPGAVQGDERRLDQVLGNLLANAVEFTPAGGRVSVTVTHAGAEAVIEVADTGAGIAPEVLPHVFDRFRQADSSITRTHAGLGLGLALVKTLAELHGGRVAAESAGLGRGATFTVRVPLREEPAAPGPSRAAPAEGQTALTGVTVLLVDDDADGREALRVALELGGARVRECRSAAEARRALDGEEPPDVLVSDIGMPGEDGYAFLRAVRAHGDDRLPAIAVTGFASAQDREAALAAGFDEHLSKPVDVDALVAKIGELMRRSGLRLRDEPEPREAPEASSARETAQHGTGAA